MASTSEHAQGVTAVIQNLINGSWGVLKIEINESTKVRL